MNEVGRELKASELKPKTVVIVDIPDKHIMITMWVGHVSEGLVEFYSGTLKTSVLNFVSPEGVISDGEGRVVKVYEYLGEI